MRLLGKAARLVLVRTGAACRNYVTVEDPISVGWIRTFVYQETLDQVRRHLFLASQPPMVRYIVQQGYGPLHRVEVEHLETLVETDPWMDPLELAASLE